MNRCLGFFLQTFCSACANLTQPSLLFHITCYGCSRSWAKQTTTEPNKNIYTQLVILQGSGTNRHRTVGDFCHTVREKLRLMTADVIWNCVHLDSVGANNPPMGLAFDRRGNQERRGGRREGGAVLNTTEQGAKGGGGKDQTTHLPFCSTSISGIGKESKKRVRKRERKVIMSQLPGTKRRISLREWPWDELQRCLGRKSWRRERKQGCLLVKTASRP